MQERRTSARKRVLKGARIRFHRHWPDIECRVRNESNGGVCLDMPGEYNITLGFSLVIGDDRMPYDCRQAWRQGKRIGITFG